MHIYQRNISLPQALSDYTQLSDEVSVSKFKELSLQEYSYICELYCSQYHRKSCSKCPLMIKAANLVLESGICSLQSVFKEVFPGVTYHTGNAKRRLLQMPIAAIQVQDGSTNRPVVYVTELIDGIDYLKVRQFLNMHATQKKTCTPLSKVELKELLILARSDREREMVRYAAFRSSGLSITSARKHFGFDNLAERVKKVEDSIEEVLDIRQTVENLSRVQDKAIMLSMGFVPSDDSSDEFEDTSDEGSYEASEELEMIADTQIQPSTSAELLQILKDSFFNWFQLVSVVIEMNSHISEESIIDSLECFFTLAMNDELGDGDKALLVQSHQAFNCDRDRCQIVDREAAAFNGQIVTDSESEDPDQYLGLHDVTSDKAKALITKKRKSLRRRARYLKSKQVAERNFLSRKVSRGVKGILKDFPNIGKEIENFVQESNVGADAWRRTGILTFDGNTRVKSKVTYERIRQHLIKVYQRNFGFGTVVQLCVARNRRRQSAKRYKGVAKVTSRRARKGFKIKYNPDAHWSSAFYRSLNYLQYSDGRHIININRDDASGFRLDTMTTHRLHRTLMVQGSESTTTYTDYVNKYKAVLQTTSYNFSKTETTLEVCAGVVKPVGLFPKNPTQHLADLEMLESAPEMKSAFLDPTTGKRKVIECVRVDGASDEGPSHEEVQFMWSARHICTGTVATLVTARNSGSSYLNRVELQNGCLALAHANLFIPSTLGGSCMDSGTINKEKYERNMNLATEVYLNRVNKCPCGDTVINLYEGADSTAEQQKRKYILQYLKGSKTQVQALKNDMPALYEYCEKVWQVRKNHMVKDLPPQYAFFLVCCLQPGCNHPICSTSSEGFVLPKWFSSGPTISYLPLPIPDPNRCYGQPNCEECKGHCCGHFMKPEEALKSSLTPMRPPSAVLKEAFDSIKNYPPAEDVFSDLSKRVLLPVNEVKIWLDHLMTVHENRKRGAAKAAETRRQRRKDKPEAPTPTHTDTCESEYQCGECHAVYQDFTDTEEQWIGCESCDSWYHFSCVGITVAPDTTFLCSNCSPDIS